MIIRKATKDIQKEISNIFVNGFKQWLVYFSKDSQVLADAFYHIFNIETFYVAVSPDEQIAGISACTDGTQKVVNIKGKELRKHLGIIKGVFAAIILKKELENHKYPFCMEPGWASVEFVATEATFRQKGVAANIIRHIIETTPFSTYVLEVADTNTAAVGLYKKLGFVEFQRGEQKHKKQSGFNYYLYMRYDKTLKS